MLFPGRLHTDIHFLCGTGRISVEEITTDLVSTARVPMGLHAEGPAPCPATTRVVRTLMRGWSPRTHGMYATMFHSKVWAVLLSAQRAVRDNDRLALVTEDAGAHGNDSVLPILPYELWTTLILKFASGHADLYASEGHPPAHQ